LARFVLVLVITSFNRLLAESVAVHHREGISHGFVVLRSIDGHVLASGDMIQVADGERITSEVIFHFKDGSLHDETTVFSQDHTFRLLSDHLIQHGPSFPKPIDILIDATKNEVTVHANEKGKEKDEMQHIELPEDLSNGMVLTLVRNIPAEITETKVSTLSMSAKPRVVKLTIAARAERIFRAAGSTRKANDFDIHTEIGGVAGAVAPLVGKQPPDTHILQRKDSYVP
jgi:2-methylaconitate cis-trans-isomerase PrpF